VGGDVASRREKLPDDVDPKSLRRAWVKGPDPAAPSESWLALEDDDLLSKIEKLPEQHDEDEELIAVIRSARHFFVRQEAAKRLVDHERLKEHRDDRHIGQILARRLRRYEDVTYLEDLIRSSRHLEVRRAAKAQLEELYEILQLR
jgi:hypothetical protein